MNRTQQTALELPLRAGGWRVDRERSEVGFAVKDMWGLRTVRGVFGTFDGDLSVVSRGAGGQLTIEADSIDTGDARRDQHLRSAAFFDVERHPHVVFTTTSVAPRDGGVLVGGDLAVGPSRAELQIPVAVEHAADGVVRLRGAA